MKKTEKLITGGFFIMGVVLIVLGIFREEHRVVFEKAIKICLECVGIG